LDPGAGPRRRLRTTVNNLLADMHATGHDAGDVTDLWTDLERIDLGAHARRPPAGEARHGPVVRRCEW